MICYTSCLAMLGLFTDDLFCSRLLFGKSYINHYKSGALMRFEVGEVFERKEPSLAVQSSSPQKVGRFLVWGSGYIPSQ